MDDKFWGIICVTFIAAGTIILFPPDEAKEIVQMIVTGIFGVMTGATFSDTFSSFLSTKKKENKDG